jgi:hypothetical protein
VFAEFVPAVNEYKANEVCKIAENAFENSCFVFMMLVI